MKRGLVWDFKRSAREQSEEDRQRYTLAQEEARAGKAEWWCGPDVARLDAFARFDLLLCFQDGEFGYRSRNAIQVRGGL